MSCGAIMTDTPLTVRDYETVESAAGRLLQARHINLPVVDDAGTFVGMFGIYDIFTQVIPKVALAGGLLPNLRFMGDDAEDLRTRFRGIAGRKVGEVADRDARVVHPDTPQIEALRLFCQQHATLAVVERKTRKLLGVVSYWDAVCALTGMSKSG